MKKTIQTLFVSTDGRDGNEGSATGPLATIGRAKEIVRSLDPRANGLSVEVRIRGGDYFLDGPLVFDEHDGGSPEHPVVYKAHDKERVRVIGGRRITEWEPVSAGVWRTKIEPGRHVQQLFENGNRRFRTRWPDSGYLLTTGTVHEEDIRRVFSFHENDISPDIDLDQAQVFIWAGYDWFTDLAPIESCDRRNRTITLAQPTLVKIEDRPDRRYFLQNIRSLLGQPGRFFSDEHEGWLYLAPLCTPIGEQEIIVPTMQEPVVLRGSSPDNPVEGVVLEDLCFEVSSFAAAFCETRSDELRTHWNEPANRKGLIHLENARHCSVRGCRIRNAGHCGIALNRHAQENCICGNHISEIGYHGVLLAGYNVHHGRKGCVNRLNRVENNVIHHCGRLVGHGAGVFGHGSGENRIAHNLIHHMPRYGICFKGLNYLAFKDEVCDGEAVTWENHWDFLHSRENRVEYNHIHHVNGDSEDSGALSFIACGRSNVVHNNLIHDCPRELGGINFGIYLDDSADYFVVTNNVIYDLQGGEGPWVLPIFAKGIGNRIINNILIACPKAGCAVLSRSMFGERCDHHVYLRNIICLEGGDHPLQMLNWSEERIDECDFNLYWAGGRPVSIRKESETLPLDEWRRFFGKDFDAHSVIADPAFVDPANRDYRLKPDSPALALGFEPIAFDRIGPLHELAVSD